MFSQRLFTAPAGTSTDSSSDSDRKNKPASLLTLYTCENCDDTFFVVDRRAHCKNCAPKKAIPFKRSGSKHQAPTKKPESATESPAKKRKPNDSETETVVLKLDREADVKKSFASESDSSAAPLNRHESDGEKDKDSVLLVDEFKANLTAAALTFQSSAVDLSTRFVACASANNRYVDKLGKDIRAALEKVMIETYDTLMARALFERSRFRVKVFHEFSKPLA